MEQIKRPKLRLPSSSLANDGIKPFLRGRLRKRIKAARPTIRQIFTMLEPKTFPTEIAPSAVKAEMKATLTSGRDVEKASKLKPIEVLVSPVMSDTLIELAIVR